MVLATRSCMCTVASGGNAGAWAYLTDDQGSVRDLVNWSGQVKDHLDYDAYGVVTRETNSSYGDRFRYDGYQFDTTTGLYYVNARWYDPTTGRWRQADPMGFEAGDSNLYRYVGNDATNATDPSGMAPPFVPPPAMTPTLTFTQGTIQGIDDPKVTTRPKWGAFLDPITWSIANRPADFKGGIIIQKIVQTWRIQNTRTNFYSTLPWQIFVPKGNNWLTVQKATDANKWTGSLSYYEAWNVNPDGSIQGAFTLQSLFNSMTMAQQEVFGAVGLNFSTDTNLYHDVICCGPAAAGTSLKITRGTRTITATAGFFPADSLSLSKLGFMNGAVPLAGNLASTWGADANFLKFVKNNSNNLFTLSTRSFTRTITATWDGNKNGGDTSVTTN